MSEKWKREGQVQSADDQLLKCIWMMSGTVTFKLCDHKYDCEHCVFDQALTQTKGVRRERAEMQPQRPYLGLDMPASQTRTGSEEFRENVFLHPAHIWARVEDQGKVRIGLDDFAQRLVGRIYGVRLPMTETRVPNGNPCWWIVHASGETKLPVPVKGVIEKENEKLHVCPSLINQDPYGDGWALCVRPDNLEDSLKNFHYGEQARSFCDTESSRLNQELAKLAPQSKVDVGATLPDGGKPFENFISTLSPEQHRKIIALFLKGGL